MASASPPSAGADDSGAAPAAEPGARHAFLLALDERLRSLADPNEIQYTAAVAVGRHLRASRVGYAADQGDGGSVVVTRNHTDGVLGIEGRYRYDDFGGTILADLSAGRTVVSSDIEHDPAMSDAERAAYAALEVRATVNVPLVKGGRLVEFLFLHSNVAREWTPPEVALIEAVADRTWVAVERARAEAALRERETRLHLAIDVAELGTWSWDLQTGEGDIDERGAEIVGLVPGDLHDVPTAQRDRVHPADLTAMQRAITDGIAAGGVFSLEYRVIHPDGSIHHVSSRARVLTDPAGAPVKLVGTNRDVTRERETEAALREREERYRTLFRSIDEGFCIVEVLVDDAGRARDYRFLEVNPAFERQTGLHDAAGHTARELVPDLEPTWAEVLGTVARSGEPRRWMDEARSMGRWFDLFAFPVGVPEQRRVAIVFTNVTDRIRAQEEREELLERERQARAAAEAFLAVMSHELRTPITSIYGTASILAKDPRRPDLAELVADMRDEAERLRRITDDLMVLSGVERGALQLSPEPVILQHAIADSLADVRRRFPEVEFVLAAPAAPPVVADTTALRQVLYNLLTNAAKYAGREGPVTVAVTAEETSALVEVLDEGPGPGDDPAALFGLFYRAPHTARRASGTGIGLYVVSALLQAMGTSIDAVARDPHGTAFRFRLPYAGDDPG